MVFLTTGQYQKKMRQNKILKDKILKKSTICTFFFFLYVTWVGQIWHVEYELLKFLRDLVLGIFFFLLIIEFQIKFCVILFESNLQIIYITISIVVSEREIFISIQSCARFFLFYKESKVNFLFSIFLKNLFYYINTKKTK